MIAQVTCDKSMMPGNSFSPRSQGVWKTYHVHMLLSKSMLNEPVIKHTAGTSPWFLILIFHVRQIGAGRKILQDAGGHFGLPYHKHRILVMSSFTVGYRGTCKCVKAALKCTALCSCGGDCN